MADYDFTKAWKEVEEVQMKDLPRTVTNKVEEIQREAIKVKRWPDAARAFLVREEAMREFTDEQTADWLPAFAASVDARPAPLQAVLQLHLAHTYLENSRRWRWGGAAPTKLDDAAAKDKLWMQMKADVLGIPFDSLEVEDAGTVGCAMMAGVAAGVFADLSSARAAMVRPAGSYEPDRARREACVIRG